MQAVAHNPAFAKKAGVPQSVGKEFTKSGGGMPVKPMDESRVRSRESDEAKREAIGGSGMKKGGKVKKYAAGGSVKASAMGKVVAGGKRPHGEHTVQQKGHTKGKMVSMAGSSKGMKRGGKC